jgi:plasmid stabilization system protein ParE
VGRERPVVFTGRAREDLLDIWDHIRAHRSEALADDVVTRIVRTCDILEEHPAIGRSRPDIDPEARMLIAERWLVLYRIVGGGAEVVRVVDGVRDMSRIRFRR